MDYITVTNVYGDVQGNGFTESFQDENSFWYNWRVNNLDENANTWGIANVGYNSSKSAVVEGYLNYSEDIDELITPSLNLAFVNSAVLSFKYSGASRATSAADANEALKIYYSANCGQTWTILSGGTMTGTSLVIMAFIMVIMFHLVHLIGIQKRLICQQVLPFKMFVLNFYTKQVMLQIIFMLMISIYQVL